MIQTNTIGSNTELYITGGGNSWITQSHPTNFHGFWKRKMLTGTEKPEDFKEVTDTEKTAFEKTDAQWERPPQAFIDMATAVGKGIADKWARVIWNEETGFFEYHGLNDITYSEMRDIMEARNYPIAFVNNNVWNSWSGNGINIRTNIPEHKRLLVGYVYGYNAHIKRFSLGDSYVYKGFIGCNQLFGGLVPDCEEVTGVIDIYGAVKFTNSTKLREIRMILHASNITLDLSPCPLLSFESYSFLVGNVDGANAVTVIVPDAVFARMNDESDTEWHQVLLDGIANGITFATK